MEIPNSVVEQIAKIDTTLTAVRDELGLFREQTEAHFEKLNGKVATAQKDIAANQLAFEREVGEIRRQHEKEMAELRLSLLSHQTSCPLRDTLNERVIPLESFVASQKASAENTKNWLEWIKPVLGWVLPVIAGAFGMLILLHAKDFLKQ